jgi:hypothetical protein
VLRWRLDAAIVANCSNGAARGFGGAGLRIQQHNPAARLGGDLCNAPAHGAGAHDADGGK